MPRSIDRFPTDITGLPDASPTQLFELADGDHFHLRIGPVAKSIGPATVRMLAYNGSIPGPTVRVKQGTTVAVHVVNEGDLEATVHWHGLRLNNRSDGTTLTQRPMPIGGSFTYRLEFPDPGVYWYHPHIREDYGQEMGLYGNIIVLPSEADYWPPVHRELTLMLDDILIEDGKIAPFNRSEPTFSAMGRFGNVLLANGDPHLALKARNGEVVRLYLTNTANTRVFNLALPGARMKLVGGDSGRYEHEAFVDRVLVAPSERAVVDVLFDEVRELTLEHRTPNRTYAVATIAVAEDRAEPSLAKRFGILRTNADMAAERARLEPYLHAEPDKTLALVAEMDMGESDLPAGTAVTYICPMHAEVVSTQPGRCPKCGMKLLAAAAAAQTSGAAAHGEMHHHGADAKHHDMQHQSGDTPHGEMHHEHAADGGELHAPAGIEWEDDMVEVNRKTTPSNMRWKLIDRATGAEGMAIAWQFRVGERVRIRLVNEMDSDHPMHHPFHIHGAGRFLILARDGVVEPNLVWKDTVLVPTGQTVDLLLDVTNPGVWMAHCHIAEHHESGMMFSFEVR